MYILLEIISLPWSFLNIWWKTLDFNLKMCSGICFSRFFQVYVCTKVWQPSWYGIVLAVRTLGILDHHEWKWILRRVQRFLHGGNCPGHQRLSPCLGTWGHGHTLRNVLAREAWKIRFVHASSPPRLLFAYSPYHRASPTCHWSELHPWVSTKKLNDASFYLHGCLISFGAF